MAHLIEFKTISDNRGSLTVLNIPQEIPFQVKRIFYIYNVDQSMTRGGHRHKKTIQGLICINGECRITVHNAQGLKEYILTVPNQCLLLDPEDWHEMSEFKNNAILLVLASEYYNQDDYIYEGYNI